MQKFLKDLEREENGFHFGEPWRHSTEALGFIVPIIRKATADRTYITLDEVKKEDIKITDTGSIDRVKMSSNTDQPIFVRIGSILQGATQERAAEASTVIMPQETPVEIPVRCVHASRGISSGAQMFYVSSAPTPQNVDRQLLCKAGQGNVWNAVSSYGARATASGINLAKRDDLATAVKTSNKFKKEVAEAIKNIPVLEDQIGVVIFDAKGAIGIELYDHTDSWTAFHRNVMEKYSDVLINKKSALFELKKELIPKRIKEFIQDLRNSEAREIFADKGAKTYMLDCMDFVGEYTEIKGTIIHFLATKKEPIEDIKPRQPDMHTTGPQLMYAGLGSISAPNDYHWGWDTNSENTFLNAMQTYQEPMSLSHISDDAHMNYYKAKRISSNLESKGMIKKVGNKFELRM